MSQESNKLNNHFSPYDAFEGGKETPLWKPSEWNKRRLESKGKQRMDIELGHEIFGHRAVSSLLWDSKANVWDDIEMVLSGDSWCDKCKIAISPRNAMSKKPMRFEGKPLQHMFLDLMTAPQVMRGVKGFKDKYYLFLCDPISRYVEKLNVLEKNIDMLLKHRGG